MSLVRASEPFLYLRDRAKDSPGSGTILAYPREADDLRAALDGIGLPYRETIHNHIDQVTAAIRGLVTRRTYDAYHGQPIHAFEVPCRQEICDMTTRRLYSSPSNSTYAYAKCGLKRPSELTEPSHELREFASLPETDEVGTIYGCYGAMPYIGWLLREKLDVDVRLRKPRDIEERYRAQVLTGNKVYEQAMRELPESIYALDVHRAQDACDELTQCLSMAPFIPEAYAIMNAWMPEYTHHDALSDFENDKDDDLPFIVRDDVEPTESIIMADALLDELTKACDAI